MQCSYIFLRFIFTIAIQLQIVYGQVSKQINDNGGLYDLVQERLKNLESNYQSNPLKNGGVFKRSVDVNYIGLYDEFKKRLDNFNAALVVDENGQPQEDKRSVASQSLYDRFKNRLHFNDNKFNKISVEIKLKDDLLKSDNDQVVKKSTEEKQMIITAPQTINKSKSSIGSVAANHEVAPIKLQDEYKKYRDGINEALFAKDVRIQRSLEGQRATYNDELPEHEDENNTDQFNIEHKTKNQNLEKRDLQEGDEGDIQEQQECNDKRQTSSKNFAIEDDLPLGTNKWSLYPRIFMNHTQIHLPPYLYTNGRKLLQNYAPKINSTAIESDKKIVRLKDTKVGQHT